MTPQQVEAIREALVRFDGCAQVAAAFQASAELIGGSNPSMDATRSRNEQWASALRELLAGDQDDRLISLQEENRKLVADYGARGDLLAEAREMFDLHVAWASDQVAMIEGQLDALGEALFLMSGPLQASGFLGNDENHRLYENVVAAFREIGWGGDEK